MENFSSFKLALELATNEIDCESISSFVLNGKLIEQSYSRTANKT